MAQYFSESEFRRCTPSCHLSDMDGEFIALLDRVLNSAYRSGAWELSHGRTGTSAHTKGQAVDIRCNTSANRYKIIAAALRCGIKRIGVAHTYIHLDNSKTHAQDVIWDYYGG